MTAVTGYPWHVVDGTGARVAGPFADHAWAVGWARTIDRMADSGARRPFRVQAVPAEVTR